MTIQEILAGGGGLLLILMTLVQIAPVKINPWSALAKAIGKAINADISKRLDEIEKKLDLHIKTDDQGRADDWRAAILRFNNELLRPIRHTKEEFVEVPSFSILAITSRPVREFLPGVRPIYSSRLLVFATLFCISPASSVS